MIRTFPVFQRDPPAAGSFGAQSPTGPNRPPTGRNAGIVAIGKLFSAFCLALALGGCAHVSDQERDQSRAHYELALQTLVKSPQDAFKEVDEATRLDPGNAEAWHVKGILLHTAFGKHEQARAAYLKALGLKPGLSECHTNLGNLYLDEKRYDDAIREYEIALNDVLYSGAFIAQGNMGWAFYKKGDVKLALDHLKAAVTMNPKFCLGYLQLGQVYDERQDQGEACKYFSRYKDACPEQADAWQRDGVCQAKLGNRDAAVKSLETCIAKAKVDEVKEQCVKLKDGLPR